jgi:hypothetical protein
VSELFCLAATVGRNYPALRASVLPLRGHGTVERASAYRASIRIPPDLRAPRRRTQSLHPARPVPEGGIKRKARFLSHKGTAPDRDASFGVCDLADVMRSSTLVTPAAAQTACSASSGQERTWPRSVYVTVERLDRNVFGIVLRVAFQRASVPTQPAMRGCCIRKQPFRVGYAWKRNGEALRLFGAFEFSNSQDCRARQSQALWPTP